MDVQIQVLSWEYYAGTIPHPAIEGALDSLTGKGDGHPVVWFRSGGVGQYVTHIAAFCWPKHQSPGQISTVRAGADSTAFNAQTFAQALGHNLGIEKDFPDGNSGWPYHYGCNNGGIMSSNVIPGNTWNRWSTCSKKDQEAAFRKSHYRCMVVGIGGVGGIAGFGGIWGVSSGSECRCNGEEVQSGQYQGAGFCSGDWRWGVDCGSFCFVDAGACPDQFLVFALEDYGYASCKPCTQSRSAPPLKEAECPNNALVNKSSPSLIAKGIGLLTAGLMIALF